MTETWDVIEHDGKRHVVPRGEGHHLAPWCWCRPTDDEGVIVHHEVNSDTSQKLSPSRSGI